MPGVSRYQHTLMLQRRRCDNQVGVLARLATATRGDSQVGGAVKDLVRHRQN